MQEIIDKLNRRYAKYNACLDWSVPHPGCFFVFGLLMRYPRAKDTYGNIHLYLTTSPLRRSVMVGIAGMEDTARWLCSGGVREFDTGLESALIRYLPEDRATFTPEFIEDVLKRAIAKFWRKRAAMVRQGAIPKIDLSDFEPLKKNSR